MSTTTQNFSRRSALALGAGAVAAPFVLGRAARADAPAVKADKLHHVYPMQPERITDGVWVIHGEADKITAQNGGAIANVAIIDSKDGAIVVDTGPSHRYGVQLQDMAKQLTGKPVARVYVTHIHSDHSLGAAAFDPKVLYGPKGLAEDMKLRGNDITNGMYRVAGDWMRGTNVPELTHVAADGVEDIGGRRLRCFTLAGHTTDDLCLFDETSGLLFPGDLVFLDRAPTTPDANIQAWRESLGKLADIPHAKLVPGHGPVEAGKRGVEQTHRWLDFVDGAITKHFNEGLDINEIMATPMPDWTKDIAVARYEYQRSSMHLMPRLEMTRLPIVS